MDASCSAASTGAALPLSSEASACPSVSIVLAVRNEERHVERCLRGIFAQNYPHDRLEVIVADGLSTDATREIVAHLSADSDSPVRLLLNSKLGRAQGLNLAIGACTGDLVVRVDARSILAPDYVSRCVRTHAETAAWNVGGTLKPLSEGLTQKAIGLALSHPFGVGNAQYRLGRKSGFVDQVYLGCYPRAVFDRIGLFDETPSVISEDSDINQRIWAGGGKVYLNSEIVTLYVPRESFSDFWKLYFRYGGARAGNFLKHGSLTSWRQAVSPAALLLGVVTFLFAAFGNRLAVNFLGVLLAMYVVTDISVAWSLARLEKEKGLFWRLLPVFPCMHLAWALGFWARVLIPERPGRYWSN